MRLNSKGMTFTELMVVLSITAILGVLAFAQYQTFLVRARKSEGLVLLNSYYNVAQGAKADFGFYPGSFVDMGFQPVGQLIYRLEGAYNRPTGARIQDPNCYNTSHRCDCAGEAVVCPNFKTWSEKVMVPGAEVGVPPTTGFDAGGPRPGRNNCGNVSVGDNDFTAVVEGVVDLRGGNVNPNVIQINDQKNVQTCQEGG